VYGIETEESMIDERLRTIFNYDEVFGTILNRFITQAVVGYPLTVYGKGGQTRGYLNLKDTLQCVHAAEQNPAEAGQLNIYNQIMETFSANDLAGMVKEVGDEMGFNVVVEQIENPRKELEEHYYNPTYQGLIDIGVKPHYLTPEIIREMFNVVADFKGDIRKETIFRGVKW
jgi:UDP-sulfoquinovose synthase